MKKIVYLYWRQFTSNPFLFSINHIGFAIGLATVILILLWINDQTSYDNFYPNKDHLFRVNSVQANNSSNIAINSPFPLTPNMKRDFPEIKLQTRFWKTPGIVKTAKNYYREEDIFLVDIDFFEMFSIEFISGNVLKGWETLNSLVITESQAFKFFGEENPIGKEIIINDGDVYSITGIIKDPPENSHMKYQILGNISLVPDFRLSSWYFAGPSYVMLHNDINYKDFNRKLEGYYSKYTDTINLNPYLQRISDIYLNEFGNPGRIKYIWIFSAVAFFIFLMVSFNNWNLSYVFFQKRKKEIKMRRISGASKYNLIRQFLIESSINILVSFVLALLLVQIFGPLFNHITGKNLSISLHQTVLLIFILIIIISISISTVYPFIFRKKQRVSTISILNPNEKSSYKKLNPIVTISQIALSIIILTGTITVYKQLMFMRNKNLGFNTESVIYIPMNDVVKDKFEVIKKEFLKIPEVKHVTASSTLPTNINWWISVSWEGQNDETPLGLAYAMVDYDFSKTLDMELIEGRSFSEQMTDDDSISYMISELALKRMEIDEPIGHRITMNHNEFPERFRTGKIIGVFKDIQFTSLRSPSFPLLIRMYKPWLGYILLKYSDQAENVILSKLSEVLGEFTPGLENEIFFLDSEFDHQYKSEIMMGKLFKSFAVISFCIFILGLLGLISFVTQNKVKEIGIRKVNGAKVTEIMILLNGNFLKWVAIAFVIATPIAYFAMDKWLENFAYKTALSWWIFALAGVLALGIALLTVSWQSWRAATRNPVEALRYE